MKAWVRHLLDWAGRVGTDPGDSPETLLQKRLTVALCAGTLPLTVGWSLIYLAAGAPLAAAVPGFYSLFTPINTAVFAWTRNLAFYRFTQLLLILLLPFLVMLALGGYRQSSAVILWAALCPLGSLLVEDLRKTVLWIVGFVVLLVIGALVEPYLAPAGLPDDLVTWFFVLNLGAVVLVVFGLLYYFVGQRNYFQERSEMLLLNILPREISETLKMGPRTIAEQFDEASILFADVVDFTPMAAGMTPLGLVELLNEVFQCFDALVE
jgi:adenylate cyclase